MNMVGPGSELERVHSHHCHIPFWPLCYCISHYPWLNELCTFLLEIPLHTGFSPKWWYQSVNVMLERCLATIEWIMHIIHLFEAIQF